MHTRYRWMRPCRATRAGTQAPPLPASIKPPLPAIISCFCPSVEPLPVTCRPIGSLTEASVPSTEALQAVSAKASHGGLNGSKRFFVGGMALRIELVGVADDLLFERLGQEVFVGQRQMLRNNLLLREARTGMAFANAGMLRIAFAAQYLGANAAMADVGFGAKTCYSWRITAKDADVVEHGGFDEELPIELQLGMALTNQHSTLHDERAVGDKNIPKSIGFGIIFVDNLLIVHVLRIKPRDAECRQSHRLYSPSYPAWH